VPGGGHRRPTGDAYTCGQCPEAVPGSGATGDGDERCEPASVAEHTGSPPEVDRPDDLPAGPPGRHRAAVVEIGQCIASIGRAHVARCAHQPALRGNERDHAPLHRASRRAEDGRAAPGARQGAPAPPQRSDQALPALPLLRRAPVTPVASRQQHGAGLQIEDVPQPFHDDRQDLGKVAA